MNFCCDISSPLTFPLQRVNARLTTTTEVKYCKMQVNYRRFIHPWSYINLTKTLKRLLLSHLIASPFLFLSSFSFPMVFSTLIHIFTPQAPAAQTFHQISQDLPSHSAAQMRCLGTFLGARIPSLLSLV